MILRSQLNWHPDTLPKTHINVSIWSRLHSRLRCHQSERGGGSWSWKCYFCPWPTAQLVRVWEISATQVLLLHGCSNVAAAANIRQCIQQLIARYGPENYSPDECEQRCKAWASHTKVQQQQLLELFWNPLPPFTNCHSYLSNYWRGLITPKVNLPQVSRFAILLFSSISPP